MKYKVNNFCVTLHPILKESMLKKSLKYTLSLALAAILLWFSFRDVEWHKFMEDLKECHIGFILISMAAGIFAFWLRALRWRELLLPIDPNTKRITTFNGINIGNISNFVFPRIGEFVRCGVIVRRGSISYEKVLGTVVLERGWELLVMLLMLALVLVRAFWKLLHRVHLGTDVCKNGPMVDYSRRMSGSNCWSSSSIEIQKSQCSLQ